MYYINEEDMYGLRRNYTHLIVISQKVVYHVHIPIWHNSYNINSHSEYRLSIQSTLITINHSGIQRTYTGFSSLQLS